MDRQTLIDNLVKEIMGKKYKILDDFFKAYIASRIDEKDFIKKIPKLVLIHKKTNNPMVDKYWIEVKRGPTRKEI